MENSADKPKPTLYKLRDGIKDAVTAIRNNPEPFVAGAATSAIFQILSSLIRPQDASEASSARSLLSLLVSIASVVVGLFVFGFVTLGVGDGAHKEREPLANYMRVSAKLLTRLVMCTFLVGLITGLPFLVLGLLILVSISLQGGGLVLIPILSIIGGIAALVWLIIAVFRYALVNYVAVFEPKLSVVETLDRSRQLMKGAGEMFVFKVGLTGFAVGVLALIITGSMRAFTVQPAVVEVNIVSVVVASVIVSLVSIMSNAVVAMLYLRQQSLHKAAK